MTIGNMKLYEEVYLKNYVYHHLRRRALFIQYYLVFTDIKDNCEKILRVFTRANSYNSF
ncbi:hypothetical protein TUM3794_39810 [Shewanella colwelliana]|uniref:Uncharacterized protein n=1 Tax=Shewanella colwelliana TaxID=23 RepID=A0ABQ4PH40_SHECO|nr:hypothetical protein TUM3794_39810 [Shewanella colwelliana]